MDKPPQIVLTGVSTLRAKHRLGGNKILELLDGVLANHPNIAEVFKSPAKTRDRLFKLDVVHVDKKKSCKACHGPDNINLVTRTHRNGSDPPVHYGTIGSADDVMKDAILRDKWAREESIICFEMEAAGKFNLFRSVAFLTFRLGLMDSFPCLVIRGICDYADSHKNKQSLAAVCGSDGRVLRNSTVLGAKGCESAFGQAVYVNFSKWKIQTEFPLDIYHILEGRL